MRKSRYRRRGNTVIAMCLLAPPLIMLAVGIGEYGSYFDVKANVQHAAREGAREATRSTATNASVQAAVDAMMATSGLQNSGYTVAMTPANMVGLPTGQQVILTVSCTWANAGFHGMPAILGGIPDSKIITETVLMNRE